MEAPSIVAIIAGAAVIILLLVYLLMPKRDTTRITQPLTVSAVIFSLDEGHSNTTALLALIGDLREKGFHVALATSASRSEFETKMAELPAVLEAMDAIVTGNEVTKPKPAPYLFLEAARRLRVDATRCVVFDESPAGIEGAQAAGMLAAAVGPGVGARFSALTPDWTLRDISAFDPRDIELPKTNGADHEEDEEEVTGLAALAKLLPPGSALQKCLAGAAGQQGGYNGLGV